MPNPQQKSKLTPDAFMQQQSSITPDSFMGGNDEESAMDRLFPTVGRGVIEAKPSLWESLIHFLGASPMASRSGYRTEPTKPEIEARKMFTKADERTIANNADVLGGAVGGAVGGVPGAIIGGSSGELAKKSYQAAEGYGRVPTTRLGAVADVGGTGLFQGGLQALGNLVPALMNNRVAAQAGAFDGLRTRFADLMRRAWSTDVPVPRPQAQVPEIVQQKLANMGIDLTAGERSTPGVITSLEPVLSKTPVGVQRASEVTFSRAGL